MTWDEGPADTLTNSVLNNLDLWLDQGADCGTGPCGEFASQSSVDNVEWIVVPKPAPGIHRVKVVPLRIYGEAVKAAVAWKIIRGESTPQLSIASEQITSGDDKVIVRLGVDTSGYVASGTTLHFSCQQSARHSCANLHSALESAEVRVLRHDGLTRTVTAELGPHISLGEIAPKLPRKIELVFDKRGIPDGTPMHVTASAWNAHSASLTLFDDTALSTSAANDQFRSRDHIAGDKGDASLEFGMASREPGEPDVAGNTRSLWYEWQAPAAGLYRFRLATPGGDTPEASLHVYTGDRLAALEMIASKEAAELVFTAEANNRYVIRTSTQSGYMSAINLSWEPASVRPANDDLANAATLSGEQGRATGNSEGATLERGEYWGGLAASTWHAWIAPSDGDWYVDVQDQKLAVMVFSGTTFDDLRMLTAPTPRHKARFRALEGRKYVFAVASPDADASGSSYQLVWQKDLFAANDDHFDDAVMLEGREGTVNAPYLPFLTAETDEPFETGIGTRWWYWTAPEKGRFTFSVDASDAFTLSFFTGERLSELTLVAVGSAGTRLTLDVEAKQTYRIALGRSMDSINIDSFLFNPPRRFSWGMTPVNDRRADAGRITGTVGSAPVDLHHATAAPDEPLDTIGRESLWWQWSAPNSGWHAFSVEGNPEWGIVSVYPANSPSREESASRLEPLATSERSYLAGGRVEAVFRARAGEQYHVRVATRPGVETGQPAILRWRAVPAPAYLSYLGAAHTGQTIEPSQAPRQDDKPNLLMHPSGERLFATLDSRLLVLTRASEDGGLTLETSIDPGGFFPGLEFKALSEATLWWSHRFGRLFAFNGRQSNAFAPPSGDSANWSRTLVEVELGVHESIASNNSFAATADDRFLYFANGNTSQLNVYRVDSATTITHVQSLQPEHGKIEHMLISAGDGFLAAAGESGLMIFAIDADSGQLSLAHDIEIDRATDTPFAGFEQLRGVVLNIDANLMFVSGERAPQVAVFDISEGLANPRHLDTIGTFPVDSPPLLTLLRAPSPRYFDKCGRTFAHAGAPAVDTICEFGHFVTLWDTAEQKLRVTDYGLYSSEDRFGQVLPVHGDWWRQVAQSPDNHYLYRATRRDGFYESDGIHTFVRARALGIDTSGNHAPSINRRLENQVAEVGEAFLYKVPVDTFADVDGDTLELTAAGLPDWLSFEGKSRRFFGTPGASDITHAPVVVEVTASDDLGATATLRFGLEVRPPPKTNTAPVLDNALSAQTAKVAELFSFEIPPNTFLDSDGDALGYSVSGLPAWLAFDAARGDVGTLESWRLQLTLGDIPYKK